MSISEIQDKKKWNDFVLSSGQKDVFLQSFQWGEFQKSYGRKVLRIGFEKNNRVEYGWQIIFMPSVLSHSYAYVPRPVSFHTDLLKAVSVLSRQKKIIFPRLDLASDVVDKKDAFSRYMGEVQPQEELIIDISGDENRLLSEMKQKTRYNIQVAKKHSVVIEKYSGLALDEERINLFLGLVQKTSKRHDFRSHDSSYYRMMMKKLSEDKTLTLFLAKKYGKYIAGNIVVLFGKMATYLHGGSDEDYKKYMAPYLLQWEAIQFGKLSGARYYNFGGASEVKKRWSGITRFKRSFSQNTELTQHAGVWDYKNKRLLYLAYTLAKKIK